jgi:CHAT domain-containing protein
MVLTAIGCVWMPGLITVRPTQAMQPFEQASADLLQQSKMLYEAGRFSEAVDLLRQAVQAYQADPLHQALALSNLSLTYQQLGQWAEASEAINQSLALLKQPANQDGLRVLAQTLDIQGRLYFGQGQSEAALESWKQATAIYEKLGDAIGATEAQINQAKALQSLGLYRRSITLLTEATQHLAQQPNSLMQSTALRSLGDALLIAGDLATARQTLEQSFATAQAVRSDAAIAAANLSLANLTYAEAVRALNLANLTPVEAVSLLKSTSQASTHPTANPTTMALQQRAKAAAEKFDQQMVVALDLYQQAARSPSVSTQIQAELKQLNLLVETQRWKTAQTLYPQIQTQLDSQPPSRSSIYNQIELAERLLTLQQGTGSPAAAKIGQILAKANQQAVNLKDGRAQSYALGTLGTLYKTNQQLSEAQNLTQQALGLAQAVNASDIAYQWQWQLGQLLKIQGDRAGAIRAYQAAVDTLQSLRNDLVAINRDVQFSFRERVEPVYRELVSLLLEPAAAPEPANIQDKPDLEKLVQARNVIEGLQVAELDNFFREACLDTQFQLDRVVDRANLSAAIVYTIVLPERLEVILKLPQQPLLHYSAVTSQTAIETTVDALLNELKRPVATRPLKTLSQQLYDWLLRPAEAAFQKAQIDTLVFVLDGSLRSIPMAALYDGQHYLIEKYSIAIAPGLQLPNPKPLQQRRARALIAGLSEARSDFPPLNNVAKEIAQIQADVPSRVLFNQDFTVNNFQQAIDSAPFSIVHIATHGEFSSNAADTFILAWDKRLNVNDLSTVLQTKDLTSPEPIELLVLSACQTAVGDRRATLGLAGVAVRAGARSTIASLWNLDDDSGALLMSRFYQELTKAPISKAEALRRAQQTLIADSDYQAPRFWAPYVLLGNWL